jgi:RNA polymerase sigma-70 factor (ECF subfamily)
LIFDDRERLVGVTSLEITGGEITAIRSVANPEKLGHLGPVGNLGSLIKRRR